MKQCIHLINPAAGQGKAVDMPMGDTDYTVYKTVGPGDVERFTYETCLSEPETHFKVFGGDGTVNEAVNGIMKAGASESAEISVVPVGTGNDFLRNFKSGGGKRRVDVIKYNDNYAVNIINIGFDCAVVAKTAELKLLPFVSGSLAYILGVAMTLIKKNTEHLEIVFTDADDKEIKLSGEQLLCLVANCSYYGGGFKAAPLAKPDDGYLDIVIANNISRLRFAQLVGYYKKGKHVVPETMLAIDKFKDVISYCRCKRVKISNLSFLCADGEIAPASEIDVTVIPKALTVVT